MADLYRIRVIAGAPDFVVRVWLHNPQASDLPAKPNVALQFVTDSYKHLREFPEVSDEQADELARLNALLAAGDFAGYILEARRLVTAMEIVGEANWERVDAWLAECHDGGGPTPAPSIDYLFRLEASVPTPHIVAGLEWTTPMFDRDE